jgi:transcription initiation factor TFIIIB Brf1 subunit/transcription initiation factor TFIIB
MEKCGVVSIRKVALIKPEMEAVDSKQNKGWNE